MNLHIQIIRELIDTPIPTVFVFVALFRIRQSLVRKQDFSRRAEIAKLNRDQRLDRVRIVLPKPREYDFFRRLDLSIRSGHAVDVADRPRLGGLQLL